MIGDFLLSIALIGIATIVRVDTASYPDLSKLVSIGPEKFPNIISWFFYAVAAILLIQIAHKLFFKKTNSDGVSYVALEKEKVQETITKLKDGKRGLLGSIGVLILMFLYAFLLKKIGFEICTVLFVLGSMLCCGERKILRLILLPLGSMFVILVVFKIILKVALPMTIFTWI